MKKKIVGLIFIFMTAFTFAENIIVKDWTAFSIEGIVNLTGSSRIEGMTGSNANSLIQGEKPILLEGTSWIGDTKLNYRSIYIGNTAIADDIINFPDWYKTGSIEQQEFYNNVKNNTISKLNKQYSFDIPDWLDFKTPVVDGLYSQEDIYEDYNNDVTINSEDSGYYKNITVKDKMIINVGNNDLYIKVDKLDISGDVIINRNGTGRLFFIVTTTFDLKSNGKIIDSKNDNSYIYYYYLGTAPLNLANAIEIQGFLYVEQADINISGSAKIDFNELITKGNELTINGNAVTTGKIYANNTNINITGSASLEYGIVTSGQNVTINGGVSPINYIYAPNADVNLTGSARIEGSVISKNLYLTGNSYIKGKGDIEITGPIIPELIIAEPRDADRDQTIVFHASKYIDKDFTDLSYLEDDNSSTIQAIRTINSLDVENLSYNLVNDYIEYNSKWYFKGSSAGSDIFINKDVMEGIDNVTNVSKLTLKDSLKNKLIDIYYPLKLNNIKLNQNSDLVNITWKKIEANKYAKYFNNQKIMFRLYRNNQTKYKYDVYNKTYNKNLLSQENYQDFIDNKIDYVDIEFNYYVYNKKAEYGNMTFIYSPENFVIQGLPINEEFVIEIYTEYSDENGDYDIYNLETTAVFTSGKPAIDEGSNATANNIYMINSIDKSSYPVINVDFFTKAPKQLSLTTDNILSNENGEIGYIKEIRETEEKLGKVSTITKSNKMGLKYPLDVIIMADGSASMSQELAAVKDSLSDIVALLESNGFDVKFNIISFEAPQDAWLLNGSNSDTNRIKFVPETNDGKDDFKVKSTIGYGNGVLEGAIRYDQFDYKDSSWNTYRSSHIVDVPSPAKKRNYGEVYFREYYRNFVQEKADPNNIYKILKRKIFRKTSGRMVRNGEYYLTVYKGNDEGTGDGWFDDLSIVQQAIKQVGANGVRGSSIYWDGVTGIQGNGAWALHYAIKRFEDYGRGLDKYGNITSNKNDIILKSKKWIIMPTDEGLDAGPRINKLGYTYNDVIEKLSEKMKNNNIYFSLIANNRSSSSVRPYTDFRNQPGLDISWHYITSNTTLLKSYLVEDAKKLGIIQRWDLKYTTPFNDDIYEEGKNRKVYFDLNLTLDTGSDAVLTKQLEDVTENSNRIYIEPVLKTLEIHITTPNEDATNRIFKVENNLIKINGWAKDKYTDLSRIWIAIKNSKGDIVYVDKNSYNNIQNGTIDTQYPFTFNIPESNLNKGEIYNVYAYVENKNGLREQKILENIYFMPELKSTTITNNTNKELFEKLKVFSTNDIIKYTSVTSSNSNITDNFYMNNGNVAELKITLDADSIITINEKPFGLTLSGLDKITFVKSKNNNNGTVDLIYNIEITDDIEEETYISGKIYNNEIVKIKVIKNKSDTAKYGEISKYKKGTTPLEPIEGEYYLNDAGSIDIIGGDIDTIGYIALYNYDQTESDLIETKTNILSSKDIDLTNNIYWNATNSNELSISTDKIKESNSLDGKYQIKKIVTISKTGKIANKVVTAVNFKNKLLEEYNNNTEGVLNSVYYMDTIAPVITDFTIEKITNTDFTDFKVGDKFNINLTVKDNKLSFNKENYILLTNPDLETSLEYEQNKIDFKDNISEITENNKVIEQFKLIQEKELIKELIGRQEIEFDIEVIDKAGNSAKSSESNLTQTITYNNEIIENIDITLTSDMENSADSTNFIEQIMDEEFKIIKNKIYFTINGKNSNGDNVDLSKAIITINNKNYTITNFINKDITVDNGMNNISKITLYSTSGYEKTFITSDSITVDSKASTLGNLKILKDNKFDSNPINNFKIYIDYKSGTNYTLILDASNMKDYTKLWKIIIKEVRIKGVKVTDLKYTDEGVEKILGENTTFEYTVDINNYETYKTKIKNNELLDGEVKVIALNISNHKDVAGGRITFKLDILDNLSNSLGSGFQIEGFVPKADFEIIGKSEESSRSRTSKVKIVGDSQNDFEVQSVDE
ncbi:hypothetical protein EV215_0346 [Hypnocyclicus thermotrophus]|uniref:VWFA domain-containing protein n=1 Tax=Hypnocyclicus thermotrophus TaxID=1627895 RepID=A0AA46I6M1_9FUSO|nr:hypothetical protein [Hypnocyclicus thermotrophus]TDT72536.1 hypothetical protein EV215_0346 [Hypnocyclicus thermotrophus]